MGQDQTRVFHDWHARTRDSPGLLSSRSGAVDVHGQNLLQWCLSRSIFLDALYNSWYTTMEGLYEHLSARTQSFYFPFNHTILVFSQTNLTS